MATTGSYKGWRRKATKAQLEREWKDLPEPSRIVVSNVANVGIKRVCRSYWRGGKQSRNGLLPLPISAVSATIIRTLRSLAATAGQRSWQRGHWNGKDVW